MNRAFSSRRGDELEWRTLSTGMGIHDNPDVECMVPGTEVRLIGCPACTNRENSLVPYVHIGSVTQDHSEWPADSLFRGAITRIHCWCENGHQFDLVLQEHKGNMFTHAANIRNEPKTFDE